jgi:predicted aldo/keto reductase-like oxidoreductase
MAHMFKASEDEAKFRYAILLSGGLTGQSAYASQCVECEECVEKCPQHIQIPEVLSRVVEEFEGGDMEQMVKMFL